MVCSHIKFYTECSDTGHSKEEKKTHETRGMAQLRGTQSIAAVSYKILI